MCSHFALLSRASLYGGAMTLQGLCSVAHSRPLNAEELTEFNDAISGLDRVFGITYTHIAGDRVTLTAPVTEALLQPTGIVHGGVYASLAESAASVGGLVAAGVGRSVSGITNHTDFLAAVSHGELIAHATPVHTGKTLHLWEVDIRANKRVVARSTVRCIVLAPRID